MEQNVDTPEIKSLEAEQKQQKEGLLRRLPKKWLIVAGTAALLMVLGSTAWVMHNKSSQGSTGISSNVSNTFDFADCLKTHTRPGDAADVANNECVALRDASKTTSTSPATSATSSSFDFSSCLKEHSKPGEDAHIATDECTALRDSYDKAHSSPIASTTTSGTTDMRAAANSTDPVERGKLLSNSQCEGSGSTKISHLPMSPSDVSIVIPYGLMTDGHVTPIDHQYYWGKEPFGNADQYNVYSPIDGTIVDLEFRKSGNPKTKGDYRAVISYSCTFFTYFDLATSLADDIQAQLPQDWESTGFTSVPVKVKAGQVVAKVGSQSLDYAVWDTTKTLKNFAVPLAYNNSEPWKINTVSPLDYYTDEAKAAILPFYARTVEPRDGVIDQDVEGTLAGTWFKKDSNGYFGDDRSKTLGYWTGHLSFAHDYIDPTGYVLSSGNINGEAKQYALINPSTKPEEVTLGSGAVKYQFGTWSHTLGGANWSGFEPGSIRFAASQAAGTALVQMVAAHEIKFEVFMGKTPSQVSDFTTAATTYTRGDDAHL